MLAPCVAYVMKTTVALKRFTGLGRFFWGRICGRNLDEDRRDGEGIDAKDKCQDKGREVGKHACLIREWLFRKWAQK